MDPKHINLLDPGSVRPPSRKGRTFLVGAVVLIAALGFGMSTIGNSPQTIGAPRGFFGRVRAIVTGRPLGGLKSTDQGRINVLLLGMGGEGHDGPYLTDTIILASVNPDARRVGLLTIPRDLVANIPGYGYRKINNANAFGQAAGGDRKGLELARETVSVTFDQPIHYVVRLDFEGFDELIDAVGGITVTVERAFTDAQYPLEDGTGKTTALHFDAGSQHMNGETALRFVRSRHGSNGEASDFARSRRQEKVLLALRDQVLGGGTLISPQHIASLYSSLKQNVATDLGVGEMVRIFSLARDAGNFTVVTKVLEEGPGAPLVSRLTEEGAFVLEPRGFDYGILRDIAANLLSRDEERPNRPRVEVQNGSTVAGAAGAIGEKLKQQGFDVVRVRNAVRKDVPKTVVFDLTSGSRPIELARLKVLLGAPALPFNESILASIPSSTAAIATTHATGIEFLVILGPDQNFQ